MARRETLRTVVGLAVILLASCTTSGSGDSSGSQVAADLSRTPQAGNYHIDLPARGHVQVEMIDGKPTVAFSTNLPDGIRVLSEWHSHTAGGGETWSGYGDGTLTSGRKVTVVAVPSTCGEEELVMYATSTYYSDFLGDMPPRGPWQSQKARDVLGENFENLTGPQTQPFNQGRMLQAKRQFYLLTGDGCMVPTPLGNGQPPLITQP